MKIKYGLVLALLIALTLIVYPTLAAPPQHGPAPEYKELWQGEARLFVADNARNEIVVVDLPDGQVTARLNVPPKTMTMGVTPDKAYLIVARGRDADRQHVSVIATGVEKEGLRLPFIAKTLLLGKAIGGVHGNHVGELWGKLFLVVESQGKIHRFDAKVLDPAAAFETSVLDVKTPDHYDLEEIGERVWVGGIRSGVRLFDQQGKEVVRFECPANHGLIHDAKTKRMFFACAQDVLVVEDTTLKTRIPYPITERIGAFTQTNGAIFGTSEGVQNLQLIDAAALTITPVPLKSTLYARATTPDKENLLVLLQNGELQVRDGKKGQVIRTIPVTQELPEMDETVAGAIMPSIATYKERAFVSLPHRGWIAEVDWKQGKLLRYLMIGGMPTRLALVPAD